MKRRRRGTGSIERYTDSSGRERFRTRLWVSETERKPVGVYDTQAEAEAMLSAATSELVSADMATLTGLTLRAWGPSFLDLREKNGIRGIKVERNRWKQHVDADPIADIPIKGLTRRDGKQWLARMSSKRIKYDQKHSRNGNKLSRTTVQNAFNLLRKALDEAVEDEVIPANPFAGLSIQKLEHRTHEPWTYLNPAEQTALLAAIVDEESRYLVAFAIGTGMRQGEQWSLRWDDVGFFTDPPSGTITVRYGSEGKPTKSGKIRRVPIFGLAFDALKAIRLHRGDKKLKGLVFPAAMGGRRDKGEPSQWKAWVAAAGIKRNIRWHDLRHTCASSLIAGWWGRRWSLYEVKEMLGHASITTTERYAHLAESALQLAAKETPGKTDVSPLDTKAWHQLLSGKEPK